jgi:uncharacterized protein with HEPN domain
MIKILKHLNHKKEKLLIPQNNKLIHQYFKNNLERIWRFWSNKKS